MSEKEYPESCLYWIHLPRGSEKHGVVPHTDITKEGYVGVASNGLYSRYRYHKWRAESGSVFPVHAAMRKYGQDIEATVILQGSPEYCLFIESQLRPEQNMAWNIAPGGGANFLGCKHSYETKEKIREANTGVVFSEERRQNISEGRKGIFHTEETKAKMSSARKGKSFNLSEEQVQAKREYMLARPPMSEECRNKISEKKKGHKFSEEEKKVMRENRARDYPDWLSMRAKKENWVLADLMYEFMCNNEKHNANAVGRHVGLDYNNTKTIYKKLLAGWIPQEDPAWLQFKEQYLTEQLNEQT